MDRRSGAWFQGWPVTKGGILDRQIKGADTSGNWRHRGTPGSVGGSLPGGGHRSIGIGAGAPPGIKSALVRQFRENRKQVQEVKAKMREIIKTPQADKMDATPPPMKPLPSKKFTAKDLRALNREWGHKIRQFKRRVDQLLVWLKRGRIGKPEARSRIGAIKQAMQEAQKVHDQKMKRFLDR